MLRIPFLSTVFVLFTAYLHGQSVFPSKESEVKDTIQGMEVMSFVEKMPIFKGGDADLLKYIQENLKYSIDPIQGVQGRLAVSFIIDTFGVVRQPTILRPRYKDRLTLLEASLLRLVEEMPAWIPGRHLGRAVPIRWVLPFSCIRPQ